MMIVSTNKFIFWAWFPVVVILALLEPFWVEIKRMYTDSLFVPKLIENIVRIREIYFK